jgi:hypothetical protein
LKELDSGPGFAEASLPRLRLIEAGFRRNDDFF